MIWNANGTIRALVVAFAFLGLLTVVPAPPEAEAQTGLRASRLVPMSAYVNVAPERSDGGEPAGSYNTGYIGYVTGPGMGKWMGTKSEAEIEAFLSSRDNWFRAVGKGGSPYVKPVALPAFAKVLSDEDYKSYREAFGLIGKRKYREAEKAARKAKDELLLGHIQAARLLADGGRTGELREWLDKYKELPEATDIFAHARKAGARESDLTKPVKFASFSGSAERADGGGTIEWKTESLRKLAAKGGYSGTLKQLDKGKAVDVAKQIEKDTASGRLAGPAGDALRLAAAEGLLRKRQPAKAWALVQPIDPNATHFDEDAMAYALWLKGLIAWTQNHPEASLAAFAKLTEIKNLPGPNRAAAGFWAARSAERMGRSGEMNRYLRLAARQPRSFYGVLALNATNSAAEYNWSVPSFGKGEASEIKKHDAGKRALALLQLEERTLAEAELRRMPGQNGDKLRRAILAVSMQGGMPGLSLAVGSGLSKNKPIDAALYPLMPWHPDGGYASDPALVLAVAKNESHFIHAAKSHAGAQGLMQIMPKTAEMVRAGSSKTLYDPELNVTLGDRYLEMLTRTGGINDNLLFIIGSYNCGPERMMQIYNAAKPVFGDDPLLFVETFPIKETRDYMQKVMASYWAYRARFNKPLKAMAALALGGWPQYKPDEIRLTSRK